MFPKREIGICYHIVSDAPVGHVRHYRFLDVPAFEQDLDFLAKRFGFTTYAALAERRRTGDASRDNSVILTFDDGFAECANVLAPLLRRRGVSGVFFVITDLVDNYVLFHESAASLCIDALLRLPFERVAAIADESGLGPVLRSAPGQAAPDVHALAPDVANLGDAPDPRLSPLLHWLLNAPLSAKESIDRLLGRLGVDVEAYLRTRRPYLTTDQIRQLHADGFTIGAHSCSHRRLQRMAPDEAEREIVDSCRAVQAITGQATVPFAFPYSGGGLDRSWLAELRKKHDFIGLFFDTDGLREDEPFVVQRVFGERFSRERTVDAILRRAWSRRAAWRAV